MILTPSFLSGVAVVDVVAAVVVVVVVAAAAVQRLFFPGYMLMAGAGKPNNPGQSTREENRGEECALLELNFELSWNFWIFLHKVWKGWQGMVLIWNEKDRTD